eukprot:CAMPEP_0168234466 /NCGR_PEP_ID=MMETSP0140_2-20121125/18278_1 /TAXON_ID=44445 /ORGANISM="Pseudo-nitzschia australis, Strain 10249 10 AB" /LENGTH=279 /DNA_ID=CAMNT_0008167255 /DNA_START=326 /DNA_END=1166 /DNA_ORIENTATION=-
MAVVVTDDDFDGVLVLPFSPIYCIGSVSAFTTTSITTTAKNLSPPRNFIESSRHSRISFYQTRATADDDAAVATSNFWTLQELEDYAASDTIGVVISFTTFGPGYRAVARAKHDESIVLGYVEGFLRPTQPELLHVDKMEIFQPKLQRVRRARPGTLNFGGVSIGLGLLLGYRCLLYATTEEESKGRKPRTVAEFLAIDDADFQHKRLVRYYRYAGFKVVKYVGEDVGSIPDRLVWGGCGTLMKQDIPVLKNKWVSLLELMKTRVEKEKSGVDSNGTEL